MHRDNITRRRLLGITGGMIGAGTISTTAAARGNGNGKNNGKDNDKNNGKGNDKNNEKGNGKNNEKGNGKNNGNGNDKNNGKSNGREEGKNTCPEGTVLLAKYEISGGKFVFEKESDYLEVGDAFDFTVTDTKDGGEIVGFDFEDADGVYDVHTVSVKTGEGVFQKTIDGPQGSFNARNFDESDPVQAVSNVILCAKVRWQIDFGTGDVPIPPNYDAPPNPPLLILAATGGDDDVTITNPSAGPKNVPSSLDDGSLKQTEFDIDSDKETASMSFTVTETGGPDLHLASFEIPGPFKNESAELAAQDLFDNEELDNPSKGNYTLEVDLPTL